MTKMQEAKLHTKDRQTEVASVKVPAFPNQPAIVLWQNRYFIGGEIGYGVNWLGYYEVTQPFDATVPQI